MHTYVLSRIFLAYQIWRTTGKGPIYVGMRHYIPVNIVKDRIFMGLTVFGW